MVFWRRGKPSWAGVNYMDLVPMQRVEAEIDEATGQVAILVPRYTDPILGRWLQPRLKAEKRFIRVPLEKRGAFLWARLDGRRNIASLSELFRREFPDDSNEAPTRVAQFLHAMYDNKFIEYVNKPT